MEDGRVRYNVALGRWLVEYIPLAWFGDGGTPPMNHTDFCPDWKARRLGDAEELPAVSRTENRQLHNILDPEILRVKEGKNMEGNSSPILKRRLR